MAMTSQNTPQDSPAGHGPDGAQDTPTEGSGGGLPMRGLAMILIAVAVLLAAWALWSLNSGDDTPAGSSADATQTEAQLVPTTTAAPDTGATQPEAETAPAPEQQAAPPAADAARGAGDSGTSVTTLHVLNNSTVPQLAARVAEQLDGDYPRVESGNLPDVVTPRNTVYFTPENPAAEQAARELADRVNGVAMARPDNLPRETEGEEAIVLVLVEDINL